MKKLLRLNADEVGIYEFDYIYKRYLSYVTFIKKRYYWLDSNDLLSLYGECILCSFSKYNNTNTFFECFFKYFYNLKIKSILKPIDQTKDFTWQYDEEMMSIDDYSELEFFSQFNESERLILKLKSEGYNLTEIAKSLKVCRATISRKMNALRRDYCELWVFWM